MYSLLRNSVSGELSIVKYYELKLKLSDDKNILMQHGDILTIKKMKHQLEARTEISLTEKFNNKSFLQISNSRDNSFNDLHQLSKSYALSGNNSSLSFKSNDSIVKTFGGTKGNDINILELNLDDTNIVDIPVIREHDLSKSGVYTVLFSQDETQYYSSTLSYVDSSKLNTEGASKEDIVKNKKEKLLCENNNVCDNHSFNADENFDNEDNNNDNLYYHNDDGYENYDYDDNKDDKDDEDDQDYEEDDKEYEDEGDQDYEEDDKEYEDEDYKDYEDDADYEKDEDDTDYEEDEDDEYDTDNTSKKQRKSAGNHSYDKSPPKSSASFRKAEPIIHSSSEGADHYYKDNYCCYCDKPYRRIDRHFERMHSDKKTVQKIINAPKQSKIRRSLINLLTNIGNERYNNDEDRNPDKIWIVKRRLAKNIGRSVKYLKNKKQKTKIVEQTTASTDTAATENNNKKKSTTNNDNYNVWVKKKYLNLKKRVICYVCRGYYSINTYARHFTAQHGDMKCQDTRTLLAAAQREMKMYHPDASNDLIRYVLPYLRDDGIGLACRYDPLIIRYGNRYVEQYDPLEQSELIRGHMRLLAKVLEAMKELRGSIKDLQSSLHPNHFSFFLEAAKTICKYDAKNKTLGNAYNGHTIRVLWNRLNTILRGYYSETITDNESRRQAKTDLVDFFDLFKEQYLPVLGSKATKVQNDQRREMSLKKNLISKADSATYMNWLTEKRDERVTLLEEKGFNLKIFKELMEFQMVLTMIFNGRRPGETERTRLWNFNRRLDVDEDDDYFQSLNPSEKSQATKYSVIIGQGKKIDGIDCTFYLTSEDVKALNLLKKFRNKAGIHPDNRYLFALKNDPDNVRMKYMKANQANKKLVKLCSTETKKLKNPEILLATNVRKTIATDFASKHKSEELALITSHLAHTDKVHKGTYRQSTVHRRVKVTSILEERAQMPLNAGTVGTMAKNIPSRLPRPVKINVFTSRIPVLVNKHSHSNCSYKNTKHKLKACDEEPDLTADYSSADEVPSNASHQYSSSKNVEDHDNVLVKKDQNNKPKTSLNSNKRKRTLQLESPSEDEENIEKSEELYRKCQSDKGMKRKRVRIDGHKNTKFQSTKPKENLKSRESLKPIENVEDTDMEGSSLSDEMSSISNKPKLKSKSKAKEKSGGKKGYNFWPDDHKKDFETAFSKQLGKGKYPSASEMRIAMKKFPSLKEKGEAKIRARFSNLFKRSAEKVRKEMIR